MPYFHELTKSTKDIVKHTNFDMSNKLVYHVQGGNMHITTTKAIGRGDSSLCAAFHYNGMHFQNLELTQGGKVKGTARFPMVGALLKVKSENWANPKFDRLPSMEVEYTHGAYAVTADVDFGGKLEVAIVTQLGPLSLGAKGAMSTTASSFKAKNVALSYSTGGLNMTMITQGYSGAKMYVDHTAGGISVAGIVDSGKHFKLGVNTEVNGGDVSIRTGSNGSAEIAYTTKFTNDSLLHLKTDFNIGSLSLGSIGLGLTVGGPPVAAGGSAKAGGWLS